MKITKIAEIKMTVTPAIKQSRSVEYEVCPHCGEEIYEKSTFCKKIGDTTYVFHRGECADKNPIDSFTDAEADEAFRNTFFGQQVYAQKTAQAVQQQNNLQQILRCPDLRAGDEIHVGKYKNVAVRILGFGTDENNQPTVVSEDGTESKVFNFRIAKLLPPGASNV